MTTIEERFAHVDAELRDLAVEGFVRANPQLNGVDFHTMMEMILDADAHLNIVGDTIVEGEAATELCRQLAEQRLLW